MTLTLAMKHIAWGNKNKNKTHQGCRRNRNIDIKDAMN